MKTKICINENYSLYDICYCGHVLSVSWCSIRLGVFLRRYPHARLFALFYTVSSVLTALRIYVYIRIRQSAFKMWAVVSNISAKHTSSSIIMMCLHALYTYNRMMSYYSLGFVQWLTTCNYSLDDVQLQPWRSHVRITAAANFFTESIIICS